MRKLSALALVTLALWGGDARAVDIKNDRAAYGPFGANRTSTKVYAGDVYMLFFDITDITVDAKTGLAKYTMTFEVTDSKGKEHLKETANKGLLLGLGGSTVPEMATTIFGVDQQPGKYQIKVTITDPITKTSQKLMREVEVIPPDFAIIHVQAQAVGFKGQDYIAQYALVGMAFNNQAKTHKINVSTQVFDEAGKPTTTEPIVVKIPDDLPGTKAEKAEKREIIRMNSPIFLNRAGRFTVVIEATDELTKKTSKLTYPLTVVDPAGK
jgi:hypothetical protein